MADSSSTIPGIGDDLLQRLFDAALEQTTKYAGAGSFFAQYQAVLSRIDRFGYNLILPNHEVAGLTFITRPKLNLTSSSLRQDRVLAMLDTTDNTSFPYAVRCLLDTNFAKRPDNQASASYCPFFDDRSPFLTPLTNCLVSLSGVPDFVVDTETTEGGFYSEAMTYARGSDFNARNYDFSLNVRDVQGGFVFQMLLIWTRWIALVARGDVVAYPEDIAARRLCYTSSIYRFVLDPSRRFITKWMKATGCFPKSVPTGAAFNINERQNFVDATMQLQIPFQVNFVEVMDPIIFDDFNRVVKSFAGDITQSPYVSAPALPENNFVGLPYIDTTSGYNELKFMAMPEEMQDPMDSVMAELRAQVAAAEAAARPGNDATNLVDPGPIPLNDGYAAPVSSVA